MDARSAWSGRTFARCVGGFATILLSLPAGCAEWAKPATRNDPPPSKPSKDSTIVVKGDADGPTSPPTAADAALATRIQDYLSNVQSAPAHRPNADLQLASDAQPAVSSSRERTGSKVANSASGSRAELVAPQIDNRPSVSKPGLPPASAAAGPNHPDAAAASKSVSGPDVVTPAAPQPPKLLGVSVRAAATPGVDSPSASKNANTSATINGPSLAAGGAIPATLAEFVERWQRDADDSSFARQLDARVMYVVAGEYEKARQPLTLVPDQQRELALRYIESLIAIRDGRTPDNTSAATALAEIERLADALRESGELSIPILAVCREVSGFGQYTPINPPQFVTGEASEFVSYLEVRDYRSDPQADGTFLTRFEMRTRVLNRAGDTVVEQRDPIIEDRCRNRRRDCFIPRLVSLPATLSPGEYVLKVTLVDKLAAKVAETSTPLRIVPKRRS